MTSKITVIVPACHKGAHLERLFSSFLTYATHEMVELILVQLSPDPALRAQLDQCPYPYRLIPFSTNPWLSPTWIAEFTTGSVILFLNERSFLDDLQALENHLTLHAYHPEVSVIGGRFRKPSRCSLIEEAYDLVGSEELDADRMDGLKASFVSSDHMSVKREALLQVLERVSQLELLPAFLFKTPSQLLLIDNLIVQRKLNLNLLQLLWRGYKAGQVQRQRHIQNLMPQERYYRLTAPIRFKSLRAWREKVLWLLVHLYRHAWRVGFEDQPETTTLLIVLTRMLKHWLRHWRSSLRSLWLRPLVTEIFCSLRFVLADPSSASPPGDQRRSRFDTLDLR